MSDTAYWIERLAIKKTQLAAFDAAIMAIVTNGQESYRLDTGQTVVHVTALNISQIQNQARHLEGEIAGLNTRIYGCGSSIAGPMY